MSREVRRVPIDWKHPIEHNPHWEPVMGALLPHVRTPTGPALPRVRGDRGAAMSADIWLEDDEGNALEFGEDEVFPMRASAKVFCNAFNLTYNLTPMLRAAGMPSWRQMVGMPASQAGVIWKHMVIDMLARPDKYKALNPANGWGTYEDAVEVLTALVDACASYPDAKVGGWL